MLPDRTNTGGRPMARNGDYLFQHRRLWYVRVQVPRDVRHLIGQSEIRKSTGTDSRLEAKDRAPAVVAAMKREIKRARATLRPPQEMRVEDLVRRYRELKGIGDAEAERFALDDIVKFVLNQTGQSL